MENWCLQNQSRLGVDNGRKIVDGQSSDDLVFDQRIQGLIKNDYPVFFVLEKSREQLLASAITPDRSIFPLEPKRYCRKDKSLQDLGSKFCRYYEYAQDRSIRLDEASKLFGVERRRIYDVVNIMESLSLVSRVAKNHYKWNGLSSAAIFIQRILAESDPSIDCREICRLKGKKKKSLQALASGFLKLIIYKKSAISLEEAIWFLMPNINPEAARAKIRRLYDIINVFKSLGIIRKSPERQAKSFQWAGLDYLEQISILPLNSKEIHSFDYFNHNRSAFSVISPDFIKH